MRLDSSQLPEDRRRALDELDRLTRDSSQPLLNFAGKHLKGLSSLTDVLVRHQELGLDEEALQSVLSILLNITAAVTEPPTPHSTVGCCRSI